MNKDIIYTCDLMGGLGNQMFQIAHVLSQTMRYGTSSVFPLFSNTQNQGYSVSHYVNNIFRFLKFSNNISYNKIFFEKNFSFNPIDLDGLESVKFHGYYQSSKNFYGFDNEIREIFKIKDSARDKILKKYPEITKENSISIHVRRGDYEKFENIHPMISKEFILKCLSLIPDSNNIYFFSDDKQWVLNNFNDLNYNFVELDYDYEELWAISLCNKNIMSNSSFSWWGSFLNSNIDKKIYCPKLWFGEKGEKNFQDIFEPYYTLIDVKIINSQIFPI